MIMFKFFKEFLPATSKLHTKQIKTKQFLTFSNHINVTCLLLTYRPRKDERLSWRGWLTCSRWITHTSGHPSAAGRAWDRESSPDRDRRSTTVLCNQTCNKLIKFQAIWCPVSVRINSCCSKLTTVIPPSHSCLLCLQCMSGVV